MALRDARERFLELRGLIELAYSREEQIQGLLPAPASKDDARSPALSKSRASPPHEKAKPESPEVSLAEGIRASQQLQQENLDRSQRIAKLIDEGLAALPKPAAGADNSTAKPPPADPAAQQAAAERQRLELAKPLLEQARQEMTAAADSLAKAVAEDAAREPPAKSDTKTPDTTDKPPDQPADKAAAKPADTAIDASREHVSQAIEHLQALRRLFFSIAEHLRETAQRQAQLNDETEQATALKKDEDIAKTVGPLALRQQQLRAITQQIADALNEQAKQRPDQAAGQQGADPKQPEQLPEDRPATGRGGKACRGRRNRNAEGGRPAVRREAGPRSRTQEPGRGVAEARRGPRAAQSPTARTAEPAGPRPARRGPARATTSSSNSNRRKAPIRRVRSKRCAIVRHNAGATAKTDND